MTGVQHLAWSRWLTLKAPPPKPDDLVRFFENLAYFVAFGMPLDESLRRAAEGSSDRLRRMAETAAEHVAQGMPLYLALSVGGKKLPEVVYPVLAASEMSGSLDEACSRLAKLFRQEKQFESRLKTVTLKPWMFAVGYIGFRLILGMWSQNPWNVLLDSMLVVLKLTILFLVLGIGFMVLLRNDRFRVWFDHVLLAMPQAGQLWRKLSAARWSRCFATMWNAGVPISHALEVSADCAGNAYFAEGVRLAARRTRAGAKLSESLEDVQLLPGHLLPIIKTAEETGDFGSALDSYADALADEAMVLANEKTATVVVSGYTVVAVLSMLVAAAALR